MMINSQYLYAKNVYDLREVELCDFLKEMDRCEAREQHEENEKNEENEDVAKFSGRVAGGLGTVVGGGFGTVVGYLEGMAGASVLGSSVGLWALSGGIFGAGILGMSACCIAYLSKYKPKKTESKQRLQSKINRISQRLLSLDLQKDSDEIYQLNLANQTFKNVLRDGNRWVLISKF